MKTCVSAVGSVNWLVYALMVIFSMASWMDSCGIAVELPILVQNLPEGWSLPSYTVAVVQVANIAPLIYTIVSLLFPHVHMEVPVTYFMISLGIVSCLLLSFFWHVTSEIAGTTHSTVLLGLQFSLALLDCSSSVIFIPFMHRFKHQYLTAFFVGEGFSSLIPGLIALLQGAGSMECVAVLDNGTSTGMANGTSSPLDIHTKVPSNSNFFNSSTSTNLTTTLPTGELNTTASIAQEDFPLTPVYMAPRFSVQVFFLVLTSLMILSLLAFILLNVWPYCKKEHEEKNAVTKSKNTMNLESNTDLVYQKEDIYAISYSNNAHGNAEKPHVNTDGVQQEKANIQTFELEEDWASSDSDRDDNPLSRPLYFLYLGLTVWLSLLILGFLPSIRSYSSMPYGVDGFHLSITLSSIAHPVGCFAAFFIKVTSVVAIVMLSAVATAIAGYIIVTAATSPYPPLVGTNAGLIVMVLCWVLFILIAHFAKTSVATELQHHGKRTLMFLGVAVQMGTLLGGIISFVLVNIYVIFREGNPCG